MDKRDAATKKLGLSRNESGNLQLDRMSLLSAVGGWLGVVESALPGLVFVIAYTATTNKGLSVTVAASIALLLIVAQLLRRRPLTQALVGLGGVALSFFLVQGTTNPGNYFFAGFVTNFAYAVALAISVVIRWPLIGILVGLMRGQGVSWRSDKTFVRRYTAATLIWVAIFSARLGVQIPLYLSSNITALGILKTLMGVPLYAFGIWLTWLMIRTSVTALD